MRSHIDDRRFGYAIAVSIVVHAVALYGGLPLLRESLQEPVPPSRATACTTMDTAIA